MNSQHRGPKELRRAAGLLLKNLRKDAELTQKDLAQLLGLEYYTFISQVENGSHRLPPSLFQGFAKAVGADPVQFGKAMLMYYDPDTYRVIFGPLKNLHASDVRKGK